MEIKTFKCPSCGAEITNTKNCEYCGSLLVRFEANGFNVKDMSYYLDDKTILPGLLRELKQNLSIQETGASAVTDIILPKKMFRGSAYGKEYTALPSSNLAWLDGEKFISSTEGPSLAIGCTFNEKSSDYYWAKTERERHEKFKQLECYNLFQHRFVQNNDGSSSDEYILDFGNDAEGAAHLFSDILRSLEGVDDNTNITYDTNKWDVIYQHRQIRNGIPVTNDNNDDNDDGDEVKIPFWLDCIITAIIVIILYLIFF